MFENTNCLADRTAADAEFLGERAFGGQRGARRKCPRSNAFMDLANDRTVDLAAVDLA
jgi:hypothetical protein